MKPHFGRLPTDRHNTCSTRRLRRFSPALSSYEFVKRSTQGANSNPTNQTVRGVYTRRREFPLAAFLRLSPLSQGLASSSPLAKKSLVRERLHGVRSGPSRSTPAPKILAQNSLNLWLAGAPELTVRSKRIPAGDTSRLCPERASGLCNRMVSPRRANPPSHHRRNARR